MTFELLVDYSIFKTAAFYIVLGIQKPLEYIYYMQSALNLCSLGYKIYEVIQDCALPIPIQFIIVCKSEADIVRLNCDHNFIDNS